jgi:hypothetical protein
MGRMKFFFQTSGESETMSYIILSFKGSYVFRIIAFGLGNDSSVLAIWLFYTFTASPYE